MERSQITSPRIALRNLPFSARAEQSTSDAVIIPTTFDPSTSNWTIILWYKNSRLPKEFTPTADHNIYSQQDGSGTGRSWLYIDRLNNYFSTFLGGSTQNFTLQAEANKWYRICLVYTLSTGIMKFYANGTQYGSNMVSISSATGSHILANNKALSGVGYGYVTDSRLYANNLTDSQILDDYYNAKEIPEDDLRFKISFSEGSGSIIRDSSQYALSCSFNGSSTWDIDVPCKGRVTASTRTTASARTYIF